MAMLAVSTGVMAQSEVKLTLEKCRERALAHNEELQKGDLEIQRAELDRKNALSARLPQIDGSLMGMTTKDQEKMTRADMLPTVALAGGYSYYGGMKMKGAAASRREPPCDEESLRQRHGNPHRPSRCGEPVAECS